MTQPGAGTEFAEQCLAQAGPILAYVQASVGRADLAEDLAQDVFAQALAARAQFTGGDTKAWLYQIARSRVAMHRRRGDVERRGLARLPRAGAGAECPSAEALRSERRQALLEAVERLSETEREALRLKFSDGFDNGWIAGALGVTVGNLGVIVHRALGKLRAELEREGFAWE
ncbi:MAG TPA: sigma-70 family RNA polymerase sigma factor [Planctomycetota bacterium]|nr:sigma-70 family RNA polymerase sigma factor [Planctomycetota bacterium]